MRILILIGLILIGFSIYTFLTSGATSTSQPAIIQQAVPLQMPVQQAPIQAVAQQVKAEPPMAQPGPDAHDTMEYTESDAGDMGEMRHPERMYRPAPENNIVSIAAESGSAAMIAQMQQYRPDFVQNGGEFSDGIVAAGAMEDGGFSSFN
jgi:hypothetical protein